VKAETIGYPTLLLFTTLFSDCKIIELFTRQ
jgi:hypothetical protein